MPERGEDQTLQALLKDYGERIRRLEVHRHGFLGDEPPPQGEGKEYATVVVAASNTHEAGRARADFVCAGATDQVTLNLAAESVPAGGGEIVLLEGDYSCSAEVGPFSRVNWRGMGPGTNVQFSGNGFILDNLASITFMRVGATGFGISLGQGAVAMRCLCLSDGGDPFIVLDGANAQAFQNYLEGPTSGINVRIFGGIVSGNRVAEPANYGVKVEAERCIVSDNQLIGLNNDYAITCDGGGTGTPREVIIANNRIADFARGIRGYDKNLILGNFIQNCGEHAIVLDQGGQAGIIADNIIDDFSEGSTGNFDGIFVAGFADNWNIQGNTIRSTDGRYGINISSVDVSDTLVTNNDLLNSGGSGSLNDAGTGTITAAGNRL